VVLSLVSQSVPSIDEVYGGTRVISLVARVDVEQSRGRHRLRLSNAYRPDVSAYLANALRPDSRTITIASQTRDPLQETLTIDDVVDGPPAARARRGRPLRFSSSVVAGGGGVSRGADLETRVLLVAYFGLKV
jgi:hypothetical protein